ncbi:MAG: B12-binding domain-containing radical SAM protein [Syntrophales bacterium]|jgi:anaerobic magnesium-protoporphyrin IX monomethyl ester cyclase
MKVLLVNPRYNGCSEIPPLGLECLAAPLLREGIDVSILDLDICSPEEGHDALRDTIRRSLPQVVGVTAMSHTFPCANEVCEIAKNLNPGVLTVMGGIHATVRFDGILRKQKDIDVCVRGEGELSFRELILRFTAGQEFFGIEGISYRKDRKIIHNADRALQRNLNDLPKPAYHLVRNEKYKTRSISSSRGCHHNCTFCSIQAQYRRTVRTRGAATLAEEIKTLADGGATRIMLTDDNFTFSLKRVREICSRIQRLGLADRVEFYAEGRIDDICRNPIMASILADAGFRGLYIGAESGSVEVLDYYQKGICPEDIIRGVTHCIEQNLTPVVNFILFGPKDTIGTMRETIRLARQIFEMGAEIVYAETLIPYPGTPIQEALVRDGKFREERGIYHFKSYHDIDTEWFLRLCNAARACAGFIHAEDRYLAQQKTYFELGCLDELLCGRIPARFKDLYRRYVEGGRKVLPANIEETYRYMETVLRDTRCQ